MKSLKYIFFALSIGVSLFEPRRILSFSLHKTHTFAQAGLWTVHRMSLGSDSKGLGRDGHSVGDTKAFAQVRGSQGTTNAPDQKLHPIQLPVAGSPISRTFTFFWKKILIEVQLIYNVVLASGENFHF